LDPDERQIEAGAALGVAAIELHTGQYALAQRDDRDRQLSILESAGRLILQAGCALHAGHGLTYHNAKPVAAIEGMTELNIGHSIVARALFVGFEQAVREMKAIISQGA
ncbi:MAG: pyridoxine 5'-phosphate synthase, partial [Pirellulales bacterium]